MPVYTYECDNCGQRFDAKQSFSDAPLTVCPTCEGKIHRVIQPVGVVFKGSGFYITDSKGKQNLATTNAKKDEGKAADAGGSSSDNGGSSGSGESSSNGSSGDSGTKTTEAKPAATPASGDTK
jgi:putative FmdB family regulatory protein